MSWCGLPGLGGGSEISGGGGGGGSVGPVQLVGGRGTLVDRVQDAPAQPMPRHTRSLRGAGGRGIWGSLVGATHMNAECECQAAAPRV